LSALPLEASPPHRTHGFTLLELMVVLLLSALVLGYATIAFGNYYGRASARQAAQVFAQDLTFARSSAIRSREAVVIRFNEANRWYQIVGVPSGTEFIRRRFSADGDLTLSAIDLRSRGDTLLFNRRGIANLSNSLGPAGEARFSSGATRYVVIFNSMGSSTVEEG